MPYVRFDIPAYDRAMQQFVSLVIDGIVALNPLIGQLTKRKTIHAGPTRNVPGPNAVDHPLNCLESTYVIHNDTIRYSNVDEYITVLFELAKRHEEQLLHSFLQTINDITDATGNSVSASGGKLTFDLFLDTIEKLDMSFDESGAPIMPTLVMNPNTRKDFAQLIPTQKQMQRHEEIIRRKKATYDAQKRTRRILKHS